MRLTKVDCGDCRKGFYVEEEENAKHCAFCGSEVTIYYTYTYTAEPTYEEID